MMLSGGEIFLGAIVVAGFSASYWPLAKLAGAIAAVGEMVEQVDARGDRIEQSAERIQESTERIARYLAAGPHGPA
jgi:hypothetical protein